ncbi:MAG: aspartyl protease family protein [Gemmatimonadales bacterium]
MLTSPDDLDRLGLAEAGRVAVRGAGGGAALQGRVAVDLEARIGGAPVAVAQAVALRLAEDFRESAGRPYQGIIGLDLFRQWVTELDFEANELRLYDPDEFEYRGPGTSLPLRIEGGHPHARGWLTVGDEPGREVELVLDTGARHAVAITPEAVPHLAFPADTVRDELGRGASGVIDGVVGRIREIRLGRQAIRDVVSSFPDPGEGVTPGAQVSIGTELLRRFRVVFDYPHDRVILEPRPALQRPFVWNPSGLHFRQRGDSLVVGRVRDDSPAALAGIEVGDVLIAVGSEPAGRLGLAGAEERLAGEPGRRVTLVTRRQGVTIERVVVLDRAV